MYTRTHAHAHKINTKKWTSSHSLHCFYFRNLISILALFSPNWFNLRVICKVESSFCLFSIVTLMQIFWLALDNWCQVFEGFCFCCLVWFSVLWLLLFWGGSCYWVIGLFDCYFWEELFSVFVPWTNTCIRRVCWLTSLISWLSSPSCPSQHLRLFPWFFGDNSPSWFFRLKVVNVKTDFLFYLLLPNVSFVHHPTHIQDPSLYSWISKGALWLSHRSPRHSHLQPALS